jgi:hypothetical protein
MSLPQNVLDQLKELARQPEGTFEFTYTSKDLFDPSVKGGVILDLVAGAHVFRLVRGDSLELSFIHASPGTGTRIATLNLKEATPAERNRVALTWSTRETALYIAPRDGGGNLSTAKGTPAPFQLQVGTDGSVFQIGSSGVHVMGARMYVGGKQVLSPTAIQAWRETLEAISIFTNGSKERDYAFQSIATNLSLVMLVTGFEAYGQKRFLELEKEGISPNVEALVSAFYPKRDREAGVLDVLRQDAIDNKRSVLEEILERGTINFQNYDSAKTAFNKGFGVKFGELGIASDKLDAIQRFIRYRHRIVHVSPLLGILNQTDVPPVEPVFPKLELAREAAEEIGRLIDALHEQTLKLRGVD